MKKSAQLDALKKTVDDLYSIGLIHKVNKQEFDVLFSSLEKGKTKEQ